VLDHEAALPHLPERRSRRQATDRGNFAIGELKQLAERVGAA
jgi:hypothetical protein